MVKLSKIKHNLDKIICTAIAVILLCSVVVATINYIYNFSEQEAFEKLDLETEQIKNDISLQMLSDRENLATMANFAAKLYAEGEDYGLLFESFKESGLFENIGILLPDNSFVTKIGTMDMNGKISFEEEAQRGEYISGRIKDLTNDEKEVIRSSVPVKAEDGTTIAIMYGVVNLEDFKKRFTADAMAVGAELSVLEGKSGNFVINTKYDNLENISEIATAVFEDGFSFDKIVADLTEGKAGYASFASLQTDENLYAHYAPIGVEDWQIMLMKPAQVVFAGARATGNYMIFTASLIILIMIAYISFIFTSERKSLKMNENASTIRKRLIEINQESDSISAALKNIAVFAASRSAFFVDTYGEDYNYIVPSLADKLLSGDDRRYYIESLLSFAVRQREEHGITVYLTDVKADKKLSNTNPAFYDFIKKHGIKRICFAAITGNSSNTSLLGVINPRKRRIHNLLKDIAVCFSMAVHNKKHLTKTEAMAVTDALTGVANRMAYKQDIKLISKRMPKSLTCIYIDVNELNYYNNNYGHAAGDQMLVFIADTLKKEFSDSHIYRMGGDEFLIFTEGISYDIIDERLKEASTLINEMKYHISIGIEHMESGSDIEELVNAAEKRMYEDKAKYYQSKNLGLVTKTPNYNVNVIETGIKEVDACLSVMTIRYQGVFSVSLKTDRAVQIFAPLHYFSMMNKESVFSDAMRQYIHDNVKPEFHRTLLSFLQYEVLEKQLRSGLNPKLTYAKIDGELITLSVHLIPGQESSGADTIWIFEKEDV